MHYNEVDRGGHFAAWEQPELYASELRDGVAVAPLAMTLFERVHMPSFAGATEWLNSEPLGPAELRATGWFTPPRDAECGDNLLNGGRDENRSPVPGPLTAKRRPAVSLSAGLIAAELLCTGALVASVILWM